jgi:sterol desaturase/sphingolipid hydroxylase (fatty acid hydroxylase superfamily)
MTLIQWLEASGEALQFSLFFGGFALLVAIERWVPRRPATGGRRRWQANLGLTLLNLVTLSLLPVSFFVASRWAAANGVGLLNALAPTATLAVVLTLLLRGFVSFATHFLMHKVNFLWRVHRVHHLDTELDVSTTVRFHPLEFVIGLAVGLPMILALGLTPWALIVYEALDVAVTLFSHANIRLPSRANRMLQPFLVTPDLHRIHHSSWQPETDSNFSAVFPVWDILFGTYRTSTRAPQESMPLGLEEVRDGREASLGWLLASPFHGLQDVAAPSTGEIARG